MLFDETWRGAPVETRQQGAGFTDSVVRAPDLRCHRRGPCATHRQRRRWKRRRAPTRGRSRLRKFTPATPATRALTPELLALAGRDLIRRGEFLWLIRVARDGAVSLLPCGSWDIRGSWDRSDWFARLDLFGPSGNTTRLVPYSAVVHGKYSIDAARPWLGISPLGWASLTGKLHAATEDALADEAGGTRGHVLPVPVGPDADGDADDTNDPNKQLRTDIASLRGSTVMVESTAAGWSEGATAAPRLGLEGATAGRRAAGSPGRSTEPVGACCFGRLRHLAGAIRGWRRCCRQAGSMALVSPRRRSADRGATGR